MWAIEDVRNMSSGLERVLLEAGETVLRVPPKLMAAERKAVRSFGKSDAIDALAIARAAVREPDLPVAALPGIEREIALLVDHRDDLIADATAHQRRLRWHLHELDPELQIPAQGLSNAANLDRVDRRLRRLAQTAQVRVCRDLLRRIRELVRAAAQLKRELATLVRQTAPQLLKIPGCGVLCAAAIIANVGPVGRFRTDAQLAAYAGVSPLDASSGRQQRHRLNRTGNRRLNRALHIIAVTQIRTYPPAKAYYARRKSEGKTNREALRTLKRHLARAVFTSLRTPALDT
ncbi:MAG TPA: IS110 family transposase [Solirubrobacteraceae bacterium]|nr:IS110 family transposase [Solirubrobacteraceae bacterium]